MKEKWLAVAFDLDSCMFNKNYDDERSKNNENAVIDANPEIFIHWLADVKLKKPKKCIIQLFSNRQFKNEDESNAKSYKTELASEAMPKIYNYIKKELEPLGIECVLDNYLLSHLFSGQTPSDVFAFPEVQDRSHCYFDDSKFIIAYMHLHRTSSQKEGIDLEYYAFEDLKKMLDEIGEVKPDYFPAQATVHLYHYKNGAEPSLVKAFSGTGKTDNTYGKTIKNMCEDVVMLNPVSRKKKAAGISQINVINELKKYKDTESFFQRSEKAKTIMEQDTPSVSDEDDSDEEKRKDITKGELEKTKTESVLNFGEADDRGLKRKNPPGVSSLFPNKKQRNDPIGDISSTNLPTTKNTDAPASGY
jgi:hypothetical protein